MILKETLWSYSNITAGPPSHVEKFVKSDSFERIYELTKSRNIDLRKESLFVLLNAITGADLHTQQLIYERMGDSLLDTLIKALNLTNDLRLLNCTLEAIETVIRLDDWLGYGGGSQSNSIAKAFEEMGGVAELEGADEVGQREEAHRVDLDIGEGRQRQGQVGFPRLPAEPERALRQRGPGPPVRLPPPRCRRGAKGAQQRRAPLAPAGLFGRAVPRH